MAVYIRSAIAISPQNTFLVDTIPEEPVVYTDLLQNILPDFKTYFEPLERRRMSRIIKTGAVCAIEAIKNAGIEKPDMIISGTGLGCIEDTEKFLNNVLTSETSMQTPTAFVQSTHNSIGALIAVKFKCHGYNVLYANKTVSFEQALLDSMMHYAEGETGFTLLNGFDEITVENYELKKKAGIFKKEKCNNLNIVNSYTSGSIPGEGATSFILTNSDKDDNLVRIDAVDLRYSFNDQADLKIWITEVLEKNNLTVSDVDLIISGINGDKENDAVYLDLMNSHFPESMHACFKHLCGEYDTASAFGLWFGTQIIRNQTIPNHCLLNNMKKQFNRIIIYNHDHFKDHSLILLSKC
jgi:3-oxoacyl-(acyl-carrier-protein) synthase